MSYDFYIYRVIYTSSNTITLPTHRFIFFFFFNDTATTEIYTLSLHDALPISRGSSCLACIRRCWMWRAARPPQRSEEHTSELQSHSDLVCRLLLEKKNSVSWCPS